MEQRRALIAGNWKMNCFKKDGVTLASTIAEFYRKNEKKNCDVLLCPPATILYSIVNAVSDSGVKIGAQDCNANDKGAYTGDISPAMIKDMAAEYVIVGHSERRTYQHETSAIVKAKAEGAIRNKLKAIICIGETEQQYDNKETKEVLRKQIKESMPDTATAENVVIAYEPVWAIGTGKTPTPHEVAEIHAFIRGEIGKLLGKDVADKMRILYGGSVKSSNAVELMSLLDVDGALVGGASLKADEFCSIIETRIN